MEELLRGLRMVVTRAAKQAEELARPLRTMGAEVLMLPAVAILPPSDTAALNEAAQSVQGYDWIVFTSVNAVDAFTRHLSIDPREIRARIACVGAATAQAAEASGFRPEITPERYVAEALLPHFPAKMLGQRVLLPRSELARDFIPEELRKRSAEVTVVDAYRNVTPEQTILHAAAVLASAPDWVLFASSSAVDRICEIAGTEALSKSRLGSIGPVTSASIVKWGLTVSAEAEPHTIAGLVDALRRCYGIMQGQCNEG